MNKPIHSKVPKLRKWVRLTEAARHLSNLYNENVSEVDILQFALDKRIKLSVFFPNGVHAKKDIGWSKMS